MRTSPCVILKGLFLVIVVASFLFGPPLVGPAGSQSNISGIQTEKKGQAEKKQETEKPAATVKVEVKEGKGKKPPEVKVEVHGRGTQEGSKEEQKEKSKLISPEEKIVPVKTEKIDEVVQEVGRRLDDVIDSVSRTLGRWVNAKAVHGIPWIKLILSAGVILIVILIQWLLSGFVRRRRQKIQEEERDPTWPEVMVEAVSRPLILFLWVYGTYAALVPLFSYFEKPFGPNVLRNFAKHGADIGGLIALIWFVWRTIRLVDLELEQRAQSPQSRVDHLQAALIGKTLRWVIIIVGAILVFQYVTGLSAAPLVASLGIGGLAVALAAKDSIANLFGTVTIVFDKPFKVGDRIKVDGFDGFVESVGYRSTRLRLWSGNEVTIPNQKIINSNVENFARRPHIWWKTNITITYDTPPDKVDKAVAIVEEILRKDPETSRTWPPWVFFSGFNDWSLNIRVLAWYRPYEKEPGQFDYFTWRQRNCRQILRKYEEEGIQFAFPSQTTYLAQDDKRRLTIRMLMGEGPNQGEQEPKSTDTGTPGS